MTLAPICVFPASNPVAAAITSSDGRYVTAAAQGEPGAERCARIAALRPSDGQVIASRADVLVRFPDTLHTVDSVAVVLRESE